MKGAAWAAFAVVLMAAGYAARDPMIRQTSNYQYTLLLSRGVSSVPLTAQASDSDGQVLPRHVLHLFADGHKGPRADRYADAMNAAGMHGIVRSAKTAARAAIPPAEATPAIETASVAGASLFMTAMVPASSASAPTTQKEPERNFTPSPAWSGLMLNASVSPDEPKTLFGGFTEDEFRSRELRCMAAAIYFEARDEPIKGQIAVAQVVMNRIRSPYYPKTICGVVYEGERLRRGCQFSFTCTGKRNKVKEQDAWATAVKLSKQVIGREVWLEDVGFATHYHATYVKPPWRHELDRLTQIGTHIFYKVKSDKVQYALLREGL